jgi:rubredoxin
VYNPSVDAGPAPVGTAFADLPDSWVCPVCGAPKSAYVKSVSEDGTVSYVHTHGEGEGDHVKLLIN